MKSVSTALCGLLLVLPLAGSSFAQSSTTRSSTPAAQSTPSAPSSHAASPNAGITSLTPGQPTPPAHPITTTQTRELLDLMNYKKMEDGNWSQMIAMNKQAAPFIPQDVWTDVQSGISGIDYVALMQPIYAKYLSEEDAAKALVFYRTPSGRKVLEAMPPILGESVAASQQKGKQVGRDAIEKHRAEIETAQKKYQAEHPPASGGPAGPGGPGAGGPGGPGGAGAEPAPSSPGATPAPSTPPAGSTAPKPPQQ